MIPQIQQIAKTENTGILIEQFARAHSIAPAHIIRLIPEKDELTLEAIHQLQKDIQVQFSDTILVVIEGLDASSAEVQNALLKSIEETSERIAFLFLVSNSALILPTILSRCTVTKLGVVETAQTPPELHGPIFSFEQNSDTTKEAALQKIDTFIQDDSHITTKTLSYILTMRKLITDNNVNPALALDSILIFLSKSGTMRVNHEK